VSAQGAQEEKVKHATRVIRNDGGLDELANAVDVAWRATMAAQRAQSTPP
jgi:hypothetical protein